MLNLKVYIVIVICIFFSSIVGYSEFQTQDKEQEIFYPFLGRVETNNLNLRTDSTISSESIINLKKDDILVVVDEKYEWYKVQLPPKVDCYVSSKYVDNKGEVIAENVNIRSGPGTNSNILGSLEKGQSVKFKYVVDSDWIKIYPTKNCFGWVHREHIKNISDDFFQRERSNSIGS